ncbi:thermonuclease family protein [Aurantimonas aggregata]|uniref:Thermonuclease family protein n=1 Tax=Aurantimonas aggregata TaxID=2047720 RepID=A0A6L9MFW9_9HYPH|nr:thermonuclease family protein [Aurantimonas aggregata]NDV86492.1 thermonuclease family protein [Aurantimonas aggregata]
MFLAACTIAFVSPFAADRLSGFSFAAVSLPELPRVIAGGYEVMPRSLAVTPADRPLQYRSMPTCRGGARAERGVTCLVDGDTGWEKGEKWRIAGIDTPELSKPECAAERRAAVAARDRMQTLMSGGYSLSGGDTDRYGRRLVTVTLSDGRDAGEVLVAEGLSQRWPNRGNPWC